jgi:CTP synthase
MAKLNQTKYIFVTGGVLSGLGKGITSASIGALLKSRGFSVNIQKCDPYLNFDAGTLNPSEHGEVFVTEDGAECDLDLGHYERFLDRNLTRESSLMSGQIFAKVLEAEREGKYLGKTVQIIPHITAEVENRIIRAGQGFEVHIVEIGGTVGDYEGLHFIEAIRQFKMRVGSENVLYAHLVYLPYLDTSEEVKTKPAQNAVRDLRNVGIQPDIILCRSSHPIRKILLEKIALFCDVPEEAVVPLPTAKSIYEVPLTLEAYGMGDYISRQLGLRTSTNNMARWHKLVESIEAEKPPLRIGIVAKYLDNADTYYSVVEAIKSACWQNGYTAQLSWIDSERLENDNTSSLNALDGIIVPGGFGSRGIEGKILAAKYARERGVPYLGLCYGLHMAVIDLARHVAGMKGAHTTEVDPETPYPVIDIMESQKKVILKGGTMRLGAYPCKLVPGTRAAEAYGRGKVDERHRHRYEFNNKYRSRLEKAGLVVSGEFVKGNLVEIVELRNHPFHVSAQFHPEFTSRPGKPNPLFREFIRTAIARKIGEVAPKRAKSEEVEVGD